MAVPAAEIGRRVLAHHRSKREARPYRRRRGETHGEHARRLRGAQRGHYTAAVHASSSALRESHKQAAAALEAPADEADYAAANEQAQTGSTADTGWESALFLLVGSGLVLWLILSNRISAVGQSLGLAAAPTATKTPAKSPAPKAKK